MEAAFRESAVPGEELTSRSLPDLLAAIGREPGAPAAGTATALVVALAAALTRMAAIGRGDAGGMRAQAAALERRAVRLGAEATEVLSSAREALAARGGGGDERRDFQLGSALDDAAAVPELLAAAAADVATLAAEVGRHAADDLRPDAACAATLAEAAARAAEHLVAVNLGTTDDSERLAHARRAVAVAGAAAGDAGSWR